MVGRGHGRSSNRPVRDGRNDARRCERRSISDLHLGLGSGADLLRRERFRELLLARLDGVDRLVLLGDVLELRDRPLAEVLEAAAPVLAALGEALAGRELVIVPGNHDHHLIEPWLERRALSGAPALGLEQIGEPEGIAFEALAAHARRRPR